MSFSAVTRILTRKDVAQRLVEKTANQRSPYLAFFSSILGGIVRDVDLMTVPIDDHLVHRGHAVFDTALGISRFSFSHSIVRQFAKGMCINWISIWKDFGNLLRDAICGENRNFRIL